MSLIWARRKPSIRWLYPSSILHFGLEHSSPVHSHPHASRWHDLFSLSLKFHYEGWGPIFFMQTLQTRWVCFLKHWKTLKLSGLGLSSSLDISHESIYLKVSVILATPFSYLLFIQIHFQIKFIHSNSFFKSNSFISNSTFSLTSFLEHVMAELIAYLSRV